MSEFLRFIATMEQQRKASESEQWHEFDSLTDACETHGIDLDELSSREKKVLVNLLVARGGDDADRISRYYIHLQNYAEYGVFFCD